MINYRDVHVQRELIIFPKRDIVIVRGKNARVWDENGKEYIDCIAGHGTASIGHCNEAVVVAVSNQVKTLISCPGSMFNDRRAELLNKLMDLAPPYLHRAFLCNSGTEAIEAAIKFARITTGKSDFICAVRGFHGRTFGAMSATHEPKYREGSEPLLSGFAFVPYNNFEKLEAAATKSTAGIILELVQGEGGVHIGQPQYIKNVRELCTRKGILLVIDEVQTGFCRTGKMFACEHYGICPDILCLAKAIAGGLPMGAVLCTERISIPVGRHGTTFGGNPLVCAAASAAIDYMIRENLAEQARQKGNYFVSLFPARDLPKVREVRHLGLMIGIELKEKSHPYIQSMMNQGILALPAGSTVIRLLPPLTIPFEDLDTVSRTISAVLK